MVNLYDLELRVRMRREEMAREIRRTSLLWVEEERETDRAAFVAPCLRVRLGLLLIRWGHRLATQ